MAWAAWRRWRRMGLLVAAGAIAISCLVRAHGRAEGERLLALAPTALAAEGGGGRLAGEPLESKQKQEPSNVLSHIGTSSVEGKLEDGSLLTGMRAWWRLAALATGSLLILPLGCILSLHLKAGSNTSTTFVAFLLTGCGCGWFCTDAMYQLVTNEPDVQQGGRMFGTLAVLCGITALVCAGAYGTWILAFNAKQSQRAEQRLVTGLIFVDVLTLTSMCRYWNMGAPTYPVVLLASVVGVVVASTTYFLVFTHVATYYGGWLVGPMRAGTDLSTLITTLLAEVQNPSGLRNRFPSSVLFAAYSVIATAGLIAWALITGYGIGLRSDSEINAEKEAEKQDQADVQQPSTVQEVSEDAAPAATWCARERLRVFACAPEFVMPVTLAVIADVLQWGVLYSTANVGARMTDPEGCDGEQGAFVYRTAVTLNRVLLPLGSLASSFAECPRDLFRVLSLVQLLSAAAVCLTIWGVGRAAWSTPAGQVAFVACFALVGSLGGYLLTMAFRYIGDAMHLPMELRHSSSRLLGLLVVVLEQPFAILTGWLVSTEMIRCTPL